MEGIKGSIKQIIEEIDEITNYLYQQKQTEGYEKLNTVLVKIMNVIDEIFQYKVNNEIQFDEKQFLAKLTEAMAAMEKKDMVLLSDILDYEIGNQLKEFADML